jgi:hypothetical protein
VAGYCEHGNELSRPVKLWYFSTEELLAPEAGLCHGMNRCLISQCVPMTI